MASSEQGGSARGRSRSMNGADEFFPDIGRTSPSGRTSKTFLPTPRAMPGNFSTVNGKRYETSLQSMARRGLLTSSAAASHVNPSPSPASDAARTTSAGCGPSSHGPLAYYDPASHSLRTCQGSLLEEWETYSGTWPRSGSMRSGTVYPRQPSVPLTSVTGSSLLPTPRAIYGEHPGMTDESHLTGAVQLWPTPRTPSGGRTVREKRPSKVTGSYLEESLAERQPETIGGQLSPLWTEWLMGFPEGWTDLEDWGTRSCPR